MEGCPTVHHSLQTWRRRTAADGSPLPRKLSDEEAERAELRAELGILLKQIRLSSVFLPALDARVEVAIEAVMERREVPPPPEVDDEEDSEYDDSDSASSEEERCHVQVLPNPPRTPPWKGRRLQQQQQEEEEEQEEERQQEKEEEQQQQQQQQWRRQQQPFADIESMCDAAPLPSTEPVDESDEGRPQQLVGAVAALVGAVAALLTFGAVASKRA